VLKGGQFDKICTDMQEKLKQKKGPALKFITRAVQSLIVPLFLRYEKPLVKSGFTGDRKMVLVSDPSLKVKTVPNNIENGFAYFARDSDLLDLKSLDTDSLIGFLSDACSLFSKMIAPEHVICSRYSRVSGAI